jgi:hypothetical protein
MASSVILSGLMEDGEQIELLKMLAITLYLPESQNLHESGSGLRRRGQIVFQ